MGVKMKKSYLVFGILIGIGLAVSMAFADDWPRWMGPNMDAVVNESGLISKFPEGGPEVLWRQPIGPGYAGPSVVGDHLYVMDRTEDAGKGNEVENAIKKAGQVAGGERVQCLNIQTGEQVWAHTYDCPYKIAYPTGPRTTPAVDGDHVYTLGAMGHLICFKSKSGEVVWEKELADCTRPNRHCGVFLLIRW